MLLASCANSKRFKDANGNSFVAETYGWADYDTQKVPGVRYEVSTGSVVWSVIFSETMVIPIWLTGWDLYEPVDYAPVKDSTSHALIR